MPDRGVADGLHAPVCKTPGFTPVYDVVVSHASFAAPALLLLEAIPD
jgi:hypothetical protein